MQTNCAIDAPKILLLDIALIQGRAKGFRSAEREGFNALAFLQS